MRHLIGSSCIAVAIFAASPATAYCDFKVGPPRDGIPIPAQLAHWDHVYAARIFVIGRQMPFGSVWAAFAEETQAFSPDFERLDQSTSWQDSSFGFAYQPRPTWVADLREQPSYQKTFTLYFDRTLPENHWANGTFAELDTPSAQNNRWAIAANIWPENRDPFRWTCDFAGFSEGPFTQRHLKEGRRD